MVHFLWSDSCMYSLWLSSRIITKLCGAFPELYAVCDLHSTFCSPKGSPTLVLYTETWHFISLPHLSPKCILVWVRQQEDREKRSNRGSPLPLGITVPPTGQKSSLFQSCGVPWALNDVSAAAPTGTRMFEAGVWENRKKNKKESFHALSDG